MGECRTFPQVTSILHEVTDCDVSQWLVHWFGSGNGMSRPAMSEDFLSSNAREHTLSGENI